MVNQQQCPSTTFNLELCEAFVSANIPLSKLDNSQLKDFLEKHFNKPISSSSNLRKKYLPMAFERAMSEIKSMLNDKFLWISVDETTDCKGRYIANLLIGVLDSAMKSTPFLISVKELNKTNHCTIAQFINESLANFFLPNPIPYEKFLLLVTDAAAYMVKAGVSMKVFYPNLIHCTCLAHGLSRVAESVRSEFEDVNTLILNGKKIYSKAPLRVQHYKGKTS